MDCKKRDEFWERFNAECESRVLTAEEKGEIAAWDTTLMDGLEPMPPKRTYKVNVKLNFRGRGKPMPYPIEDDIEASH